MNLKLIKDTLIVELSGDIDEYAVRRIRDDVDRAINQMSFRLMIMDFRRVGFVDSTGLGFIMGRYKKVQAKGGCLAVRGMSAQVDKVFRTSGVYTFAPIIE